jgi:CelD/BcsL family acetyltransferase involved in cellulose biosynthesis
MGIHVEMKTARTLDASERATWQQIQAETPALASPYFALDYFDAVAAVRSDVRVIVERHNGTPRAFLPLQIGLMGHARPLGGPLCDHHGVIASPGCDVDLAAMLRAGGVSVFDFHGLVGTAHAGQGVSVTDTDGSWVADLSAGLAAFKARQKKPGGNTFRTLFAARRKLAETGADMRFTFDDRRGDVLDQLMAWKSAQYGASGHFDVFSVGWTRALLGVLQAKGPQASARGIVSSLEVDGRLVAAHFGMMGDRAMHYWFPVYDPQMAKAAPGNVLLDFMLEALCERGICELHLGPGDYRYKGALGSWQMPLKSGYAAVSGPAATLRWAAHALEHTAEALPLGPASRLPGKAFRRIDQMTGFRAA